MRIYFRDLSNSDEQSDSDYDPDEFSTEVPIEHCHAEPEFLKFAQAIGVTRLGIGKPFWKLKPDVRSINL